MFDESYVDTAYLIQVATYLYYEYLKLSGFALVKKQINNNNKNNTYDDTIHGNPFLKVTQM